MSAFADLAAELKMDELDFFLKNADQTDRAAVYKEQLGIAADLIGYKQKAHLRGDKAPGPIKRGLGMSMHTWGGRGHASECDVTICGGIVYSITTRPRMIGLRFNQKF